MKAVCIRQPFATLVALREKPLEIRSWRTRHRGELLVCVSRRPHEAMGRFDMCGNAMPVGVALCVVDVVDARPATPDDEPLAWVVPPAASFAWVFANARPVEPFPVSGKLSFFEVDDALIRVRDFVPPADAPLRAPRGSFFGRGGP